MESTTAYILCAVVSFFFLLLAAAIAAAIKFEGGSNPQDPKKRRLWFWILAVFTPVTSYLLGYFVFVPDGNVLVISEYMTALGIATGIGFLLYIILGFILSKLFRNGKIGNWF